MRTMTLNLGRKFVCALAVILAATVTVHAQSLEELKWFVEEKIESDVGQLIGSPDD